MRIDPHVLSGFGFFLFTLLFASSIPQKAPSANTTGVRLFPAEAGSLRSVQIASAGELATYFSRLDYTWPPSESVPPLTLQRLPADFAQMTDSRARKHLFLRALLPTVLAENRRLREQRRLARLLLAVPPLPGGRLERWLKKTAAVYRVQGDLNRPQNRAKLLRRLDEIPNGLVLAQAAIESGWGTSRFALEGNSLFGQWTYAKNGGLAPADRAEGATHSVRAFPRLQASVRSYLHNLNVGHAYQDLREERARLRAAAQPLDPLRLARHLQLYSQRGEAYVEEIRRMLASPDFAALHLDGGHKPRLATIAKTADEATP